MSFKPGTLLSYKNKKLISITTEELIKIISPILFIRSHSSARIGYVRHVFLYKNILVYDEINIDYSEQFFKNFKKLI